MTVPETTIVLCATPRSGSTLVCEDMRNTGVLGWPEEYFIPWDAQQPKDYSAILGRVVKQGQTSNGVFAIKIMASQLAQVAACLSGQHLPRDPVGPAFADPFYQAFRQAQWVFIHRQDYIRQAISQVIAKQTRINHATRQATDKHFAGNLLKGYRQDYNQQVVYDFDEIHHHFLKVVHGNAIWLKFFERHAIEPLRIEYVEQVEPKPDYLYPLAERVGVRLVDLPAQRTMVKLANQMNDEWSDRFVGELMQREGQMVSRKGSSGVDEQRVSQPLVRASWLGRLFS